jgi:hypothetical protein
MTSSKKPSYYREVMYLLGDKTRELHLMIILFIAASMLDLVGVGLIAPYVALVVKPTVVVDNPNYQYLISLGAPSAHHSVLILLSVTLLVLFFLKP